MPELAGSSKTNPQEVEVKHTFNHLRRVYSFAFPFRTLVEVLVRTFKRFISLQIGGKDMKEHVEGRGSQVEKQTEVLCKGNCVTVPRRDDNHVTSPL
jgi:hypothetical protein